MKNLSNKFSLSVLVGGVALLSAQTGIAATAAFDVTARSFTKTVVAGNPTVRVEVPMWGFRMGSSVGGGGDFSPGPQINVPAGGRDTLEITLYNSLPEPVSIVIPGLQHLSADKGSAGARTADGRATSFVPAVPAYTGTGPLPFRLYRWTTGTGGPPLPAGTYLYYSGTHSAVQVQMGLYGAVVVNAPTVGGVTQVYPGVPYNTSQILLLSEIDPAVHAAVASGTYGPGLAMSSTTDSRPTYFLINGLAYPRTPSRTSPLVAGTVGQTTVLRILNAGLDTRVALLDQNEFEILAEDGKPYPYSRKQYSIELPSMKALDVIVRPASVGVFPFYDRRLGLANGTNSPGGALTFLRFQ